MELKHITVLVHQRLESSSQLSWPKYVAKSGCIKMFYLDSKKCDILFSKQKCMVLTSDPRSSKFGYLILLTVLKYSEVRTKQTQTEICDFYLFQHTFILLIYYLGYFNKFLIFCGL